MLAAATAAGPLLAAGCADPAEADVEHCDGCGVPTLESDPLAYCLWCDAVIHERCAGRISCDHGTDSDWRQMIHEAAPEEIEHAHGHELIVARLELSDLENG